MAENGNRKNGPVNRIAQLVAPSTQRVASHTPPQVNDQIQRQIERNIAYYKQAGREAIEERLRELDEEWDVERILETQMAGLTVLGVLMGVVHSKKWLLISGLAGVFLLGQSLQGWSPQLPVLRRLGIRTSYEIDQERYALMRIRDEE